jgi:CheY-like chemotaxis protein
MSQSAKRPIPHATPVVLCVDDDAPVLELLRLTLEKRGYSVLSAGGGDEALEVLCSNSIDLIVVDYDMPGMKGHELAKEVKSLNPRIPVVMQSGTPDLPEAVTKAADLFLVKGVDLKPLVAAIATLIRSNAPDFTRASLA